MAGFVPNEHRARMLDILRGAGASSAALYLGLAVSIAPDPGMTTLVNIVEPTTGGYARILIPSWNAATTVEPIQAVVPTAFAFATLTEDMVDPVNYAFMTDASSGTTGQLRYVFELPSAVQGKAGEPILVPANSLILE